jgi:hypothetical protein
VGWKLGQLRARDGATAALTVAFCTCCRDAREGNVDGGMSRPSCELRCFSIFLLLLKAAPTGEDLESG